MFKFFFLPLIFGFNIRLSEEFLSPSGVHDKCDQSELTDLDLECAMQGISLECTVSNCGGHKFRCNCNVSSYVFLFYDETKCRWEYVEQEPCTIPMTTTTGPVYKEVFDVCARYWVRRKLFYT